MTPREVARLMARAIFCPNDPDGEPSFVETEKIVRGLAALREAGFAVVPREPTDAMALAAPGRPNQGAEESMYHGIWRAMLAAAEGEQR